MKRMTVSGILVLALAGCGSGGTTTVTITSHTSVASSNTATETPSTSASTPTSTTATTTSSSTPAPAPLRLTMFRSPTANIGCELVAGFARCDIAKRNWTPPPRPANCPLDYGQGLEVGRSGTGHLVCAGDTALNPQATPLNYGSSSRVAPITCTSATAGMTCTNTANGHGFFISIQSYRTF